jgi:uncharacterized membrane protein YfhO
MKGMAPGKYDLRVESEGGGFVVLTESWYPGWGAEVDGAEAEILRANHLFQAVRVGPGPHEIRFRYRSRFLGLGAAIAGAAALAAILAWGISRRRRPA